MKLGTDLIAVGTFYILSAAFTFNGRTPNIQKFVLNLKWDSMIVFDVMHFLFVLLASFSFAYVLHQILSGEVSLEKIANST